MLVPRFPQSGAIAHGPFWGDDESFTLFNVGKSRLSWRGARRSATAFAGRVQRSPTDLAQLSYRATPASTQALGFATLALRIPASELNTSACCRSDNSRPNITQAAPPQQLMRDQAAGKACLPLAFWLGPFVQSGKAALLAYPRPAPSGRSAGRRRKNSTPRPSAHQRATSW